MGLTPHHLPSMLTSMTGFGRTEVALTPHGMASVEVRTLNHRFLEIECRLPNGLQPLEEPIRSMVQQVIRRGHVRVVLNLKRTSQAVPMQIETRLARQYLSQIQQLKRRLKVSGEVTLEMILGLPQVMTARKLEEVAERDLRQLQSGIRRALAQAVRMRKEEGRHLRKSMARFLKELRDLSLRMKRRLPIFQRDLKKRFSRRIQTLVPGAEPAATVAEAASLVQATDCTEELERIESHLLGLKRVLFRPVDSPGRTMDFLAQELHREVNTLGTKARDARVVGWVVAMKGQIEKLREQASNIE